MKDRKNASRIADSAFSEEAGEQAISFVVRIWKEAGQSDPLCRGWIEHVQSRRRSFFLTLEQLPAIIARYIDNPTPKSSN